jgi:hypothetical protein
LNRFRFGIGLLLFACVSGLLQAQSSSKSPNVVTGTYTYRTDAESLEQLGDTVCFHPRSGSQFQYSRPSDDRRLMWFCFTNIDDVKQKLRIPPLAKIKECGLQGQATVKIEKYQTGKEDTDDFDVAHLVAVRQISKTRPLVCPH